MRFTTGYYENEFYESELMGKIYMPLDTKQLEKAAAALNFPNKTAEKSAKKMISHISSVSCIPWVEQGRIEVKYGLYREYWGGGVRFSPSMHWALGLYCYHDIIGQERNLEKNKKYSDILALASESSDIKLCMIPIASVA